MTDNECFMAVPFQSMFALYISIAYQFLNGATLIGVSTMHNTMQGHKRHI